MDATSSELFDTSEPWRLSPKVTLRDESFGALAYHHDTRRLVFLKSPELVHLVRSLGEYESADAAIDAIAPADQHARYARALDQLHRSELLSGR